MKKSRKTFPPIERSFEACPDCAVGQHAHATRHEHLGAHPEPMSPREALNPAYREFDRWRKTLRESGKF